MPLDPEIRSLASALGHPPPIPKHALATLRDATTPADIRSLHFGHTPEGGDTVAVIATTADRVVITSNRPRVDKPLHDVALADLDACVAVEASGPGTSLLVLVSADPTRPLIVTAMTRFHAERACAAIRRALPVTDGRSRSGHWSAALPCDLSVAISGRLLNDPTRPVTRPHRVVAALTSTGVVLLHRHRRGPHASFVRWATVDTVDIETVCLHHDQPTAPARVRRLTAATAPSGAVVRLGTPAGAWVIEARSVQPSKLRTDLQAVLLSAPATPREHPDDDSGSADDVMSDDKFQRATAGPRTRR